MVERKAGEAMKEGGPAERRSTAMVERKAGGATKRCCGDKKQGGTKGATKCC